MELVSQELQLHVFEAMHSSVSHVLPVAGVSTFNRPNKPTTRAQLRSQQLLLLDRSSSIAYMTLASAPIQHRRPQQAAERSAVVANQVSQTEPTFAATERV
jgi:hypothetical protein